MARAHSNWLTENARVVTIVVTAAITVVLVAATMYVFSGYNAGHSDYKYEEDDELQLPVVQPAGWGSWIVDNETWPDSMSGTALAIDSNDRVHVAYYGNLGKLVYATNAGGAWAEHVIDFCGYYASIAVDSHDEVHVCYFSTGYNIDTHQDEYLPSLMYATSANGWIPTTIESLVGGTFMPSVAVDSQGAVHVAYFRQEPYGSYEGSLRYATNAGGSWKSVTIDASGGPGEYFGEYCSIGIDSHDHLHIAYENFVNTDPGGSSPKPHCYGILRYATNESGSWEKETVEDVSLIYRHCSISVDPQDRIHLASAAETSSTPTKRLLEYATLLDDAWRVERIVTDCLSSSISVDSHGNPHILCLIQVNYSVELMYLNDLSGNWTAYSVDSYDLYSRGVSLAVDSADNLHASYYCSIEGHTGLKYATSAWPPH